MAHRFGANAFAVATLIGVLAWGCKPPRRVYLVDKEPNERFSYDCDNVRLKVESGDELSYLMKGVQEVLQEAQRHQRTVVLMALTLPSRHKFREMEKIVVEYKWAHYGEQRP